MAIRHPALALIAVFLVLILAACRDDTPQPANDGNPAEVFSLATVGVSGDEPIATLGDLQATASSGTPSAGQGSAICQSTPSDDPAHYIEGAPVRASLAPEDASGDPLTLSGFVYVQSESGCAPLANATLEIWHADADGEYDTSDELLYRGKIEADEDGHYTFMTIIPGALGDEKPVIYARITHPDAETLSTRLFVEEGSDPSRILVLSETDSGYTSTYSFVLSAD